MIAIQTIAFATIMRFLSLRPERSCRCSMRPSACSAIIDASLEDVSKTIDPLAAVVPARCSFAIIGERVTPEVTMYLRQIASRYLFFSEEANSKRWRKLASIASV